MKNYKFEKYFWGIFLILGAAFILISSMGYLPGISTLSLILTVVLLAILIKGVISISFPGILFPIAFLCIIYSERLGLGAITPWPVLGAALLGSIGLGMIFHKGHNWCGFPHFHHTGEGDSSCFSEEQVIDNEDDSVIRCSTSFGGIIKYVNSDDFRQAFLETSFGSLKVYFNNAHIKQGPAAVKIEASFGGIELYVPRDWKVQNNTRASFGALDIKGRNETTELSPTLIIEGEISFAGVTVYFI